MALINTTTTGVLGTTIYGDGSGDLTIQQNGALVNKITSTGFTIHRPGTVLQVVSANVAATTATTTSTSFVTTNFSASITPTSATSKVYVVFMGTSWNQGTSGYYGMQTLYRGSTNLGGLDGMTQNSSGAVWHAFTISYVDSPATTSSTTYAIYHRSVNGSNQVNVGWGADGKCTFVLMEIAA